MNVLIAKFDKRLYERELLLVEGALMGAFYENYAVAIILITDDEHAIIPHKLVKDNLTDKLSEQLQREVLVFLHQVVLGGPNMEMQ